MAACSIYVLLVNRSRLSLSRKSAVSSATCLCFWKRAQSKIYTSIEKNENDPLTANVYFEIVMYGVILSLREMHIQLSSNTDISALPTNCVFLRKFDKRKTI